MWIEKHSIKPSFGLGWDCLRVLPEQTRWRVWLGFWIWHINVVKPHTHNAMREA